MNKYAKRLRTTALYHFPMYRRCLLTSNTNQKPRHVRCEFTTRKHPKPSVANPPEFLFPALQGRHLLSPHHKSGYRF